MVRSVVRTIVCLLVGATFTKGPEREQRTHEVSYECAVEHIYVLDNNGGLRPSNYSVKAKGDRFQVSRITGQITGTWLTTAKAASVEILRAGNDSDWSFQALALFNVGAKRSAQLIEIRGWDDGTHKRFLAASPAGAGIITGFCKSRP
jgi:hypothetical protein